MKRFVSPEAVWIERETCKRGPGFEGSAGVINGFSDLILDLYGPETGMHARMAPGVATLPLNQSVFVGAEVEVRT